MKCKNTNEYRVWFKGINGNLFEFEPGETKSIDVNTDTSEITEGLKFQPESKQEEILMKLKKIPYVMVLDEHPIKQPVMIREPIMEEEKQEPIEIKEDDE